jgi:outer membrane protein insertion porin family
VDQGPRVYIERIDIHGNTRTRDYVIRREFDLGEGDPYNKTLIDLAERRLNGLGYFKSVKITNEPGSSPDRVIIDVAVEDQPTGTFSISGGYSTTDGFIAEASVTESNFLGRGEYARVAASLGQYSRGVEFNFTEPYFLGYRMAAGFDLYHKETDNSRYALYDDYVTGGTLRLGIPVTNEVTFSPHYSLYASKVSIPNDADRPYNDCTNPLPGITPGTTPPPPLTPNVTQFTNCLSNGEASLALKQAQGDTLTSLVGYSIAYNNLDNPRNPTQGLYATATQDIAGLGGDSKFVRTTGDLRYYHPVVFDNLIGIVHLQGGDIWGYGSQPLHITDNFNLGPSLVRGFAPGGIGPRDVSDPYNSNANSLGGTKYAGASAEIQFPILGVPREIGLKGAIFADAGTLFGYEGQTNFANFVGNGSTLPPGCAPYTKVGSACWMQGSNVVAPGTKGASPINQGANIDLVDSSAIRSSVGASLLWASPLGPIRFNYAFVLSKAPGDVEQRFSFSGGSSF